MTEAPEYVLGISAYFHDSAAALLRDGEIVAAVQEERFTRVKQDPAFPRLSIQFCLEQAGITPGDLAAVVFYENPLKKFDRLMSTFRRVTPRGFPFAREALVHWTTTKLRLPQVLRSEMGTDFRGGLHFVDHHESHAASAFFPSPFQEAAILTLDAVGEWTTSAMGIGAGNRIELRRCIEFPDSLGMLYSAFTQYCGFKVNSGEYKLMGLAPYGRPMYLETILDEVAEIAEDGSVRLNMDYFVYDHRSSMTSSRFHALFGGEPRGAEERIGKREMDLAASVQRVCELAVLRAARTLHHETGLTNLVMAGGVALNCVANGRLLREGPFQSVWIQPAAGDAGGALGAALLYRHQAMDRPRLPRAPDAQKGSFLGPSYSDLDVRRYLEGVGANFEAVPVEDHLLDRVAELLDQERVVGWFQGRMEFGPRALGHRSILGDPRSVRMQQVMNLKIKFRESFRPFAPCILREHVHEIFETAEAQDWPYMLFVAPVRPELRFDPNAEEQELMDHEDLTLRVSVPRSTLPAVTHVDYSARVQTVDAERHGRFYRLLRRFYERTACPVLVNTSFNIRGEPIVCSPADALYCFLATDMDCLVMEHHVLLKEEQPPELLVDRERYRARFELD